MKKLFIGILILGALIGYSFFIRHEQPKLSAPTTPSADNASTKSNTSSPAKSNNQTSANGASGGSSSNANTAGTFKDGSYTGSTEDAYYGNVQVKATISGGKISSVDFLDYPHTHSTSIYINKQAMPYLQQEAIKAQSSNVNIVSGATYTSQAFIQSLSNALSQAS